jgi:FAD/FMN-containing dehydrogenase
MLWNYLGRVNHVMQGKAQLGQLGDPPKPYPVSAVGRGWSFSNIIGADKGKHREVQLMCEGLTGVVMLAADELHPDTAARAGSIALVAGGMRLRELANWAARQDPPKSLKTSGTHLGATVAGVIGTASHGSRLGFGGTQNMIVGIQLITGIGTSVWIERGSAKVLTEQAMQQLAPAKDGKGTVQRIANDANFEDALIHLGCMGIVNCVAIELVDDIKYDVLRVIKPVTPEWLDMAAEGKWREIAAWLGRDREPVFYEATLDPHDWAGARALHTLYFVGDPALPPTEAPEILSLSVGDAMASFGEVISIDHPELIDDPILSDLPEIDDSKDGDWDEIDWGARPADMNVFDQRSQSHSAFEYYIEFGKYGTNQHENENRKVTWREIHGDEITGGTPGALYNASYAIRRSELATAIPAICASVRSLPRSFVFTIRFVSNPAGTLAFTRFPENAVIEIDGISPWLCRRTRHYLPATTDSYGRKKKMLQYLEFTLPEGAKRVRDALKNADIGFSNHWAKRSFLSSEKIQADFGPLTNPQSRIMRWRATRDVILSTPLGKAIFWNWGVVNLGLLDRPTIMPPSPPE